MIRLGMLAGRLMNPRRPAGYLRAAGAIMGIIGLAMMVHTAHSQEGAVSIKVSLDALQWRNIGPFRGGRATAVAGVASDPRRYYMGTVGGGIFETTDAGAHWHNISDGYLKSASVGALAVAPSDPSVIYAGMGEATARANALHSGDGVYKSTDGGGTWRHVGLVETREISRIVIDPHDPGIVYVAAQGALYAPTQQRGIYRTRDGGKTWQRVLFAGETAGAADLAMDPRNPAVLYAALWDHLRRPWGLRQFGPASGLYQSTDGGSHWRKLSTGLPPRIGKLGVAVSADPDRVYALIQADPASQSGLYRSDDSGRRFERINSSPSLTHRASYYLKVFADPRNADVVWVTNSALFRSTDAGYSFRAVKVPHEDTHELWIDPRDSDFLAEADDGGATISVDGGQSWSTEDNQPTAQIYRVAVDDRFPYWVYGAQQDNTTVGITSRSSEAQIGRQDWHPVGGEEDSFIAVDPLHADLVYSTVPMGVLSVFSQRTRIEQDRPVYGAFAFGNLFDSTSDRYRWALNAPIFVSRHDPRKLYVGAQKLLLSTDRGKTWRAVSPDLTRLGLEPGRDRHLGSGYIGEANYGALTYATDSPRAAGLLWTGSSDGSIGISRDGGKSWSTSSLPGLAADARINCIDPSAHDPAVAYVAATRFQFNDETPYLFRTNDYGKTWTRISRGLPEEAYARAIREDPMRAGLLYAGTETGAYVSFDDGRTWQPLGSKLPVTPITDLKIHGDDLIASTSGRSFWILDDLSVLRQWSPKVTQSAVYLFRPEAAIRTDLGLTPGYDSESSGGENRPEGAILDFYLKAKGVVTIEVLDRTGRLVHRFSGAGTDTKAGKPVMTQAGLNRFVWDLRYPAMPSLPATGLNVLVPPPSGRFAEPGTYTIRLIAAGQTLTAPLIVKADPRWSATSADYAGQDRLSQAIATDMLEIESTLAREHSAPPSAARLSTKRAIELYAHFAWLYSWVNSPEPDMVASERDMASVLHRQWRALKSH